MNYAELCQIREEIELVGTSFEFVRAGNGWNMQVAVTRPDAVTGNWGVGRGGKYYVSSFSTRSEVIQKMLGAALAYAEHEVRENFRWKGKAIFHPHYDVDALYEICDRKEVRGST